MSDKFSYYDIGNLRSGQVVEVTLSGNAANVCLVDSSNFNSYRRGGQYRYHGGSLAVRQSGSRSPAAGTVLTLAKN